MKYKTTKKALRAHYGKNIYYVYMNSAKRLLGEPQAYTTRAEGWACDVWEINGICITEGYSPLGVPLDYDLCKEYEEKAKKILANDWPYKRQQAQIAKLRDEFLKMAIKEV